MLVIVALVLVAVCALLLWSLYCEAVRQTAKDPEETWLDTEPKE